MIKVVKEISKNSLGGETITHFAGNVKLFGRNSLLLVFGVVFTRDKIGGLLIYLGVALYGKKRRRDFKENC